MNEELQIQAATALQKLIETATATGDFVLDQAPEVIEQLLAWNFTISLICLATLLICGVLGAVVGCIVGGWASDYDGVDNEGKPAYKLTGCVVCLCLGLLLGSVFTIDGPRKFDWLKIKIAPKGVLD